jgi:pheromone shutdown protein TraB
VDQEEEKNVTRLKIGDKEVILIGTAHVSKASAEQVGRVIREERPDSVCVELCPARLQKIKDPESWKKTDLVKILKEGKLMILIINLVLASHQKKIAEKFGINPGQEMLEAISAAEEVEAELEVIDRDVKTTLNRTWGLMSLQNKAKLFISMIGTLTFCLWTAAIILFLSSKFSPQFAALFPDLSLGKFTPNVLTLIIGACFMVPFFLGEKDGEEEVTEESLEKLKEQDMLENLLTEMGENLPDIKKRLIDERDLYMIQKLRECDGEKMVAVVGAGHVPGMKTHWKAEINLAELEEMPKPSLGSKILTWSIPAALVAVFVVGMFYLDLTQVKELIVSYILYTGGGAAIGAAVALSHPWTILLAFLTAPLTVLHPALGVGMFTGVSEAVKRKPTAGDFETLIDDFSSVKGWMKNRVMRVILTVMLSSFGTIAGVIYFCKKNNITNLF